MTLLVEACGVCGGPLTDTGDELLCLRCDGGYRAKLAAKQRVYYERHREERAAYRRTYYERHREERAAKRQA